MHVRVSSILNKPEDYKVCTKCGKINWYERENCISCGSRRFRKVRRKDVLSLIEYFKEVGHYCEDCEIEV